MAVAVDEKVERHKLQIPLGTLILASIVVFVFFGEKDVSYKGWSTYSPEEIHMLFGRDSYPFQKKFFLILEIDWNPVPEDFVQYKNPTQSDLFKMQRSDNISF